MIKDFLNQFKSILLYIINISDLLDTNRVSNFSYRTTITEDDLASVPFAMDNVNNIPAISETELTEFEIDKGYRSKASTIAKNVLNHFWGRGGVSLNFLIETFVSLITSYKNQITQFGTLVIPASSEDVYSRVPSDLKDFIKPGFLAFVNDALLDSDATWTFRELPDFYNLAGQSMTSYTVSLGSGNPLPEEPKAGQYIRISGTSKIVKVESVTREDDITPGGGGNFWLRYTFDQDTGITGRLKIEIASGSGKPPTGSNFLRDFRPCVVTQDNIQNNTPLLPSDIIKQNFNCINHRFEDDGVYSGFAKTSYGYKSTFFNTSLLQIEGDYTLDLMIPRDVTSNCIAQSVVYIISNSDSVSTLTIKADAPRSEIYFIDNEKPLKQVQLYVPARSRQMLYITVAPELQQEYLGLFINYLPY